MKHLDDAPRSPRSLRSLVDPTVPLGRLPYLALGVVFTLLKIGADALIAHHYGRVYSLLFYVDPTSAPLLRPGEMQGYWLALCYATVPFAVVGILLTLRRLRDAGASPWLALFFFVPFANLLFFLATALLPPYRAGQKLAIAPADPYRAAEVVVDTPETRRSRPAAILYSAALGSVVALGGFAISVGLFGRYGYGLALGMPIISGFVVGIGVPRLYPGARARDALVASLFTFAISFALIILFALEGLGCLVLFLPLFIVPSAAGTLLGFAIGRHVPRREHGVITTGAVLLLLVTFGVEAIGPALPHEAAVVETALDIDAPPETVWPLVIRVDELPLPLEAPFNAGIAYPTRATLDSEGVGAVRRCEFNTGVALETVTVWDPARRLQFRIDSQPDPLRELTLYRTVRQPHLDGAVRNRVGEFELVPLDGGQRTRLVGRSWYATTIHPTFYWEAYSDRVIHAIHLRVMSNVKRRAEIGSAVARQ